MAFLIVSLLIALVIAITFSSKSSRQRHAGADGGGYVDGGDGCDSGADGGGCDGGGD